MTSQDASTGMRLAHQGRFEEALPHLDRAHRREPANLALLHALASALQATGRRNAAVIRYRDAATALPDHPEILAGWARAAWLAGNKPQAIELLDRALALDSAFADPGGMLDMIVTGINDPDKAGELLRPLVERHPKCANLVLHFAYLMTNAERLADACGAFTCYAALRADDATPHVELSRLATNRGDRDAALDHLRTALVLDPDNGAALWEQAQIEGGLLDGDTFAHVEGMTRHTTDPRRLAPLHDVLSRHFDRAGDFARAIAHLEPVKAIQRELALPQDHYDPRLREREADVTIEMFRPAWFERMRDAGSSDSRPVFIVGMPRSGTTLLQQMLCGHPGITSVGEQTFADASFRRAMMAAGDLPMARMPHSVVREAADWHVGQMEDRLVRLSLRTDAERIIDKLPDNFVFAGWLSAAFPNATIIHCLRDPRDVAISCWRTNFSRINWTRELEHIAHRIEQHRRMMRHWRATIGERLTELRYENLIADPEPVLRRLVQAIGLEWDAGVLEHTGRKGHIRTASQYQVEAPLNSRGIGHWRNYEFALAPILPRLEAIVAHDAREATADLRL
ncbi:MAG: sulfotransferase [Proteobacteria bacterium]|nr:sulfotransferase [Pseudomonadota bacterium]